MADVPQLRRQDKKNRQNSIDDIDIAVQLDFQDKINSIFDESFNLYQDMIAAGVAKECGPWCSSFEHYNQTIYVRHNPQLASLYRPTW